VTNLLLLLLLLPQLLLWLLRQFGASIVATAMLLFP
jgi:hypothetical protein